MSDDTVELTTSLRVSAHTPSGIHEDESHYLIDLRADIIGIDETDSPDAGRQVVLGEAELTVIRVTIACENGANLFTLFDQTAEASDLGAALFEDGMDDYIEPVRDAFPEAFPHLDILHVRWLAVRPFARGQRVGISALHRLVSDWDAGCGLVALRPQPPQCGENIRDTAYWDDLALGDLTDDLSAAANRLTRHFGELGFKRVGRQPFMLRSPAHRQIPVQELDLRDTVRIPRSVLETAG